MARTAKLPNDFVPGVRFRDLLIGADKDDIIEKLGLPEYVNRMGPDDNDSFTPTTYWCYPKLGLDIEFDIRGEGRVTTICIYARKFEGYRVAKFRGPKTRQALYKLFGPPHLQNTVPSEFNVKDAGTGTWTDGYHCFFDKKDNITCFYIFTTSFAEGFNGGSEQTDL